MTSFWRGFEKKAQPEEHSNNDEMTSHPEVEAEEDAIKDRSGSEKSAAKQTFPRAFYQGIINAPELTRLGVAEELGQTVRKAAIPAVSIAGYEQYQKSKRKKRRRRK